MCGICGCFDLQGKPVERPVIERMMGTLVHRGPDSQGIFVEQGVGLGFRRLSIIDLATGDQPLYSEDRNLVVICNGEIYNHVELAARLRARGHRFSSGSDVEVLLHLYEEHGAGLLEHLNGQWSFALYDRRRRRLLLARDPVGITPLFYTLVDGVLLFGSEIKAILAHPAVRREVDLTGLDQVLSFPGLVPPRTLFKGIRCLEAGHLLEVDAAGVRHAEYWDLVYPEDGGAAPTEPRREQDFVAALRAELAQAVRLRLRADVPVGFYLSGGLDSSLIGALMGQAAAAAGGAPLHSFSISFPEAEISEAPFQRLVARQLGTCHHEIEFTWAEIQARLAAMVQHCECPVKETFDTCALALSERARAAGVPVLLAGQGADELFGGYPGYRFDQSGLRGGPDAHYDADAALEDEIRERLWGDGALFYETEFLPLREVKRALYGRGLAERLDEFEATGAPVADGARLRGRHRVHQRSYLDFKLRLAEHLLSEHGDRMALAHSVEARYPFLDPAVIALAVRMPPDLKVRQLEEKYIVKRVAEGLVPPAVIAREKFGFRAPGSPYLLREGGEWIADQLSYERIRAQGYFNPDVVERLKDDYRRPGFTPNPHFEIDLLMVVLTFGMLVDQFGLPRLG